MPCNDCSRTEECPPCPHEEREKPSPVDCPHVGSRVVERSDAPEHWTRYRCDDCGGAWSRNWSEGGEKTEEHEPRCQGCGHPEHSGVCREPEMPGSPGDVDECGCLDDREPPLTPEEHNLGPEGVDCVFDACPRDPDDCDNGCRAAADELSREANEMNPPPEEEEEASEDACTCGAAGEAACQDCLAGVHGPNAHREPPPPEGPEYTPCVCGHIEPEHEPDQGECNAYNCDCSAYCTCEHPNRYSPGRRTQGGSWLYCPDCEAKWYDTSPMELLPPQPDRRPPYLLAYSVQGHLYEVALPGDATVAALDGRLVITHRLGPVAGICQIAPITSEESA